MRLCKMLKYSVLVLLLLAVLPLKAQVNKGDRLVSTYRVVEPETKEDSKVKIFKTADGKYKGQVIWLAVPTMKDGTPKRDILNPDPKKRNTPGDQIVLLWGFTYDAEKDMWVNGEIYDPCQIVLCLTMILQLMGACWRMDWPFRPVVKCWVGQV